MLGHYGTRRYQSDWPQCAGHTRFSIGGIQPASGSLKLPQCDEPACSACDHGIGEFTCAVCNRLLCFSCANWDNNRRRYFCAAHEIEGETEEAA